jgi:2-oxoisovalerate dehydrogenase E2 component (dihydrolipoyl transacylase)
MATEPSRIFVLPDLGEGLQDAEIVTWHVAEGDHVVADQPLVSVETDKAVVEIPSPRAGRIARLLAAQHARLPIGAPLVAFTDGVEHDTGTVVGELAETAPASAIEAVPRPRAVPAVRALAASLGVDLASVTASGPQGAVTRADVERAAGKSAGVEPLRGVRRAMALRMAEAGSQVVPATLTDEADVEAWPAQTPVAARLVAALAAACRAEPALNAAYDGKAVARRLNAEVHVGIAVDTEDGLLVPVLRNAERLDLAAIDQALQGLVTAVKARRVAPDSLRGASITLSNFGPLGGRFATLVVVPPQVAILGAGRIEPRAVALGDSIVARRVLPISLSFDHRAISGGEAARFLAAVKAALESPL